MFPPLQIPGQGPSAPGSPRVLPGLPEMHPVNWPTTSSSIHPPESRSGAPGRPPISLPNKRFQLPAQLQKVEVTGMGDSPPLLDISCNDYDADDESDDSSDLGGAGGKPLISL